jgi:lipopolysaccharide biosynthesis glycosyltransferase
MSLDVGDTAPDFTSRDQNGNAVTLSELRASGAVTPPSALDGHSGSGGSSYARYVLVSASDEKYSPGLIVMIASVLERLPAGFEVDVVVYDDGLADRSREELARVVGRAHTRSALHVVRGYSTLGEDLPERLHLTQATYSRLLLPDLSPDIERAVYLDADMLVLDDVSELFSTELGHELFAACRDVDTPTIETGTPYSFEALGLPPESHYYNAGILVFDAATWRDAGVAPAAMDYVRTWEDQTVTLDQDGINVVGVNRVLGLDRRFNFQVAGESHRAAKANKTRAVLRYLPRVAVVHFVGPKPWLSIWFRGGVWGWVAARWWGVALSSRLLSVGFRARMLRLAPSLVVRELTSRLG